MTDALRSERGTALFSAIALLIIMLTLGLAGIKLADSQSALSPVERVRESSFAAGEAALDAQVVRFAGTWPMVPATAFPAQCTPTTTGSSYCPDPASLKASLEATSKVDPACGGDAAQWQTTVRDNGSGTTTAYKKSVVAAQPTYDANADGLMWVRAEGRARCKLRAVVTLVRADVVTLAFPRVTIGANWFWTNNQGRKVIVDTLGAYAQPPSVRPDRATAQPAPVAVRCTPPFPNPCLKIESNKGQVSGSTPETGSSLQSPALAGNNLELVKARARARNTYYAAGTCPPSLTGEVVYIEDMTGCPSYAGGNDKNNPGMVVIGRGTLAFGGNRVFYGVVYARNEQGTTGAVVQTSGTATIQGSVVVDGLGGVIAGASSTSVVFDPRTPQLVRGMGSASKVPGTWREVAINE